MENKILTQESITALLHQADCEVTFTKLNDEMRTMPATLRPEALPVKPVTEGVKTRTPAPGVISAWCLDKQEWRSFRVDRVISVVPYRSLAATNENL